MNLLKTLKALEIKEWEYNSYEQLVSLIKKNSKKLAPVLPSFLIDESMKIFSELELYDKCIILRDFAKNNPHRIKEMSKSKWFND